MPKPYSHKHRDSERFFLLEHLLFPLSLTISLSDTDFIISSSLDNSDDASSLVTLTALFAKNVLRKKKKGAFLHPRPRLVLLLATNRVPCPRGGFRSGKTNYSGTNSLFLSSLRAFWGTPKWFSLDLFYNVPSHLYRILRAAVPPVLILPSYLEASNRCPSSPRRSSDQFYR
jgi:hypothetical protein